MFKEIFKQMKTFISELLASSHWVKKYWFDDDWAESKGYRVYIQI